MSSSLEGGWDPFGSVCALRGWRLSRLCKATLGAAAFLHPAKLTNTNTITSLDFIVSCVDLADHCRRKRLEFSCWANEAELPNLISAGELLGGSARRYAGRGALSGVIANSYRWIMIDQDDYDFPGIPYIRHESIPESSPLSEALEGAIQLASDHADGREITTLDVLCQLFSSGEIESVKGLATNGMPISQVALGLERLNGHILPEAPTILPLMGDVLEGGAHLTLLPCSTSLRWTDSVQRRINHYVIPDPRQIGGIQSIGNISPLAVPKINQRETRFIAYAASVPSETETKPIHIRRLGANVGHLTHTHPEIRIIESVLMGTGHGGLDDITAAQAIASGYLSTAVPGVELRLLAHGRARYQAIETVLKTKPIARADHTVGQTRKSPRRRRPTNRLVPTDQYPRKAAQQEHVNGMPATSTSTLTATESDRLLADPKAKENDSRHEINTRLLSQLKAACDSRLANHIRGKRFEEFSQAFFDGPFKPVRTNYRTIHSEIDLIMEINSVDRFWTAWGTDVFIECKNLDRHLEASECHAFISKTETARLKLGFLVSLNGFTKDALAAIRSCSLAEKRPLIVPITGEGIRELLERNGAVETFLKNQVRDVLYQLKSSGP